MPNLRRPWTAEDDARLRQLPSIATGCREKDGPVPDISRLINLVQSAALNRVATEFAIGFVTYGTVLASY
jgi:hypothetical protein